MDLPHPIAQAAVEVVVDVAVAVVVVVEVAMTLDSRPADNAAAAAAADNPDCTHRSHFVLDRYSFQPC